MHDLASQAVQSVLYPLLEPLKFVLNLRVYLEGPYFFLDAFQEELFYFVGCRFLH
jgi:hypothetical protein